MSAPPPRPAGGRRITKFERRRRHWYRYAIPMLIAAIAVAAAPPLVVAYASQLPDPSQVAAPVPSDTLVYASDGTTLLADLHHPGYRHYNESLAQMGPYLPEAVVAVEDHSFYSEPGIDPVGIARAAVVDIKSGSTAEGASTITQQLVKIRLLGDQPTLERKFNEAWLAIEVERRYSKSQILGFYLNDVDFGNSAVGAAAASQIYFHLNTNQLDLAQAAMLAGLVRGPTLYDPFVHWQAAKSRQQEVLNAMVSAGKITPAEADRAYQEDVSPPNHMFMPAAHVVAAGFVDYVTQQLVKRFGPDVTYGGGLSVVTTINMRLQQLGQQAISNTQASLAWRNVQQGALVAIDPTSGAIIAMVSSANSTANGGQYNLAVWPPRNPGSSMKIYTYTAAIASGKFTMTTPVQDGPLTYQDPGSGLPYTPQNYDGSYHGTCQVQQCLGNSLNIPAVKVELDVGVPAVVQTARSMGAPPWIQQTNGSFTNDDPLNSFGPSLTLGGYGETPLQMATGASVLAAQGVLHQPFAIARVGKGSAVLYSHAAAATQVLDPRVAYIMSAMLSRDANRAMIFGLGSELVVPGWQVAVKTGTSDSFADAWTVGYTPKIAVAVWMGNPDWRMKMTEGSDSYYVAVPAWHAFLTQALPVLGAEQWYAEPTGLVDMYGNYYLPGTTPSSPPFEPGQSQGSPGHKKRKP